MSDVLRSTQRGACVGTYVRSGDCLHDSSSGMIGVLLRVMPCVRVYDVVEGYSGAQLIRTDRLR